MKSNRIGILGAGTMGRQLGLLFASRGFSVTLWNHRVQPNFKTEFDQLALIQSGLGWLGTGAKSDIVKNVNNTTDLTEVSDCELVIEAVSECFDVKSKTLRRLAEVAPERCILATNTSTLSITELALCTRHPNKFIGLHFFNPPLIMKLVEVVKGEFTSEDTVQFSVEIIEALGKHPVVLAETPGFVVNRLLFPMINEAVFMLSEGVADAKTIDGCMRMGANHPMGPLELADLIGLDICLGILETLVRETGDGKYRPAPLLRKYVRAGKLGKKTGCGFFNYKR